MGVTPVVYISRGVEFVMRANGVNPDANKLLRCVAEWLAVDEE